MAKRGKTRKDRRDTQGVTMTNETVLVMTPPINDGLRDWARRLRADVPGLDVVVAEDDVAASEAIARAEAVYGWVSPEMLPSANRLRWLQSPFAAPFAGYYYPELNDHPVTVTNARGIYSDHISHHIMMFMLALSRGLPYWVTAQHEARWDSRARKHGYVSLTGSTVLVVGVGGIGA